MLTPIITSHTDTLHKQIDCDEEITSPVTIVYDYDKSDDSQYENISVTDIRYEVQFGTETPEDIILDQVKEHITQAHAGKVEFWNC